MKYAYKFRLTEAEAIKLKIKLKEPIIGLHPPSKDWELIQQDCGKLFLISAIFLNTPKFQWNMFPNFEWKTKILLPFPLTTTDYFSIIECRPIELIKFNHCACLQLNGPSKDLCWNTEYKDIRTYAK